MINKAGTDQLDDAIDVFEEHWTPRSREKIGVILEDHDLVDDYAALTELIRIDIELRYKHDLGIRLDDYFEEFEGILSRPQYVAQIAFEDFRSRSAHGHPVSISRWRKLPGVSSEVWYQQLPQPGEKLSRVSPTDSFRPTIRLEAERVADGEFESALETIGFRLVQEIGQGAFSHVYLATQNDLADRHVVLKVVEKTLAEPQNMAMLQHTNIVPIYSFHRIQSRSVICMPYAGAVTLADFLRSDGDAGSRGGHSLVTTVLNRVHDTVTDDPDGVSGGTGADQSSTPAAEEHAVLKPLEQLRRLNGNELALWMFERLAAALAHSHARGVLHGDLKPANVLIRNDGEPALLDFNLAHALDQQATKHVGGTLPYMPPESYRALMGQVVAPRAGSDLFGIGVMLFEFVTGRLPFPSPPSSAPIDLEPAIRARSDRPAWKDDDEVSPGLRSIINRCLAFDVEDRYATAEQLQEDIAAERDHLPLRHARERKTTQARKWVRRHPRLVSSSSVGLLLLALLIPIAVAAKMWQQQSRHLAVMANVNEFAEQSAEVLAVSIANPLRHSDEMITQAIAPLESFGILDSAREAEFVSPKMSDAELAEHRDTALRHLLHTAFVELGLLRGGEDVPVAATKLKRVDRLIDAAARLQGSQTSRACLYAQAERAALAGASNDAALTARAAAMPIDNETERYLEAVRLLSNRKYSDARRELTILSDSGKIPSALRWTLLGRSQYRSKRYEDAKISFTQSLEHAPNASRLWLLRGLSFYNLKQYKLAAEDFSEAIRLEPTLVSAYSHRALCRAGMLDDEGALEDYDAALRIDPGNGHVLLLRSRKLLDLDRIEESDRDFAQALKATDLSPPSLFSRARARKLRGDLAGSLADLKLAEQKDRGYVTYLTEMGHVLSEMGRDEEALETLTKALELAGDRETIRINRAVLLARLGRHDEAVAERTKAMKPPNAPYVQYQAACVHAILPFPQGNPRLAVTFLSKALQGGYGADKLLEDPDLFSLHDNDEFRALKKTVELGNRLTARKKPLSLHSRPPRATP